LSGHIRWQGRFLSDESFVKILHLREKVPWFGGHSGYEQLTGHLSAQEQVWTVKPRRGLLARYLGSTYARLQGRYGRGADDLSEQEFRWHRWLRRPDACHILYLEHHLELLNFYPKACKDIIGTVHVPAAAWKPARCKLLSHLNLAIALYQRDIPFFEQTIGSGRVRFIHHGADAEFFKPDSSKLSMPPRILYSGVYLRNEAMLVRVVKQLTEKMKDLRFDLLVPLHHRKSPMLAPLLDHPAVTWHAGLNDEELRALYQRSHLMLLPMNDSGANTAVVEALTSGLPVVTTDVGGIRDYGGETVFPIVANNDDDTMIALMEHYLSKSDWRDEMSRKCRQFAQETLAWPLVAEKHLQTYRELAA
jgi:glycosyltransferase involved in cell wall biosynthesis